MKFNTFSFPTFSDARGNLTPIEFDEHIPFLPKRAYVLTQTKMPRGGHAHKQEQEVFICVAGSFTAKIHDGAAEHKFVMNTPGAALYTNALVWHEFADFSPDAVMLALSSTHYEGQEGYIMNFDQFLKTVTT